VTDLITNPWAWWAAYRLIQRDNHCQGAYSQCYLCSIETTNKRDAGFWHKGDME
jgi:hypothetical protein